MSLKGAHTELEEKFALLQRLSHRMDANLGQLSTQLSAEIAKDLNKAVRYFEDRGYVVYHLGSHQGYGIKNADPVLPLGKTLINQHRLPIFKQITQKGELEAVKKRSNLACSC